MYLSLLLDFHCEFMRMWTIFLVVSIVTFVFALLEVLHWNHPYSMISLTTSTTYFGHLYRSRLCFFFCFLSNNNNTHVISNWWGMGGDVRRQTWPLPMYVQSGLSHPKMKSDRSWPTRPKLASRFVLPGELEKWKRMNHISHKSTKGNKRNTSLVFSKAF